MWIKECWEVANDLLDRLHDPRSSLRKSLDWLRQAGPLAWKQLTTMPQLRLPRRGKSFVIASSAYLSVAFAMFALMLVIYTVGFVVAVSSLPGLGAKQMLAVLIAASVLGFSVAWECKACVRSARATAAAWKKVSSVTRLLTSAWFAMLVGITIAMPALATMV